jgi:hypothetical protein
MPMIGQCKPTGPQGIAKWTEQGSASGSLTPRHRVPQGFVL